MKMPTAAEIRLAAGELTAGEMRTVKAVLEWFIKTRCGEAVEPIALTVEEVSRWLHEESVTLHPADDFEGPRLTLINAISEAAIRYLRSVSEERK